VYGPTVFARSTRISTASAEEPLCAAAADKLIRPEITKLRIAFINLNPSPPKFSRPFVTSAP
jgi:hypothetical protein